MEKRQSGVFADHSALVAVGGALTDTGFVMVMGTS